MKITTTLDPKTRHTWRRWLEANHAAEKEIWVLLRRGDPGSISYLDAVEEALCFGWVDGIAKRFGDATAQRFSPRRPRSHWTELNKERVRRLIRAGQMTEAGLRTLPHLGEEPVVVAPDIRARLEAEGAWASFQQFPELYQRVRLGYVEEMRTRDPKEWARRLANLIAKTAKNQMFGNWDDSGLARTEGVPSRHKGGDDPT